MIREFVELVNCGFLALRTEAALLMWMTQAYFASLELPPLMVRKQETKLALLCFSLSYPFFW